MASITIHEENRRISDPAEISAYLEPYGIWYEKWDVEGRISPDATNEEILEAYAPEIERLKERGGFVTADVINVNPETPGLDAMLAKFSKEHTHSEDEVRFTVSGAGVFHIHVPGKPVIGIQVEQGDLINVPEGTQHWFDLCSDKQIRCIRLFQDQSGWAPHYIDDNIDGDYSPVCWGPNYMPSSGEGTSGVKL